MFRAFSFSFLSLLRVIKNFVFSFLHINYKPAKGNKSTLNAKKFYTITLPNYPRSSRCQIQTLSARPKFAGQNGAENPGSGGLRGATNPGSRASYGAENYFPGNKMGLHSGSSKLSIFSFLDLRETRKMCYNYYRKEKEKKIFAGFAQWFSSNR